MSSVTCQELGFKLTRALLISGGRFGGDRLDNLALTNMQRIVRMIKSIKDIICAFAQPLTSLGPIQST
jgi:hypothetical protein